tara:strand:- start:362 stop:700 length:339 start_codon:yes stop_codon:yes gene_type:complete
LHKDEWTTASREQFSATAQQKEDFKTRQKAIEQKPAGVPGFREKDLGDLHLVGENFELCDIPVQRAWMAQEDPGLREYLKYYMFVLGIFVTCVVCNSSQSSCVVCNPHHSKK